MRVGKTRKDLMVGSTIAVGCYWEEWVSQKLTENNIPNILMPFNNKTYDILALDSVRIDVKTTDSLVNSRPSQTIVKSPTYHFKLGDRMADFYVFIIRQLEVAFVVPKMFLPPRSKTIRIPYPPPQGMITKYSEFIGRWDFIRDISPVYTPLLRDNKAPKIVTAKLLPETKEIAKQQAAARGLFLYEYLAELVKGSDVHFGMDASLFHDIAVSVQSEWEMGGLAGTVYEEFALEVTKRYLAKKHP